MSYKAILLAGSAAAFLCGATCDHQWAQASVPVAAFILMDAQLDPRSGQATPAAIQAKQADPVQPAPAQSSSAPLPNAPSAETGASTAAALHSDEQQSRRIMGMLPNFRSVTAGVSVPRETTREKLATATLDNFDYTSLFFAGLIAADSQATKATPEFRQGMKGYARYYWHTVADQAMENYAVELILPTLTHEDSRYFAMGREGGGYWKRVGYSMSRVLVANKESGGETFNISEIAGSALTAGISNFYYPSPERTVRNGFRNWGLNVTYDAVTFAFHEFWPDISHLIFRKKSTDAAGKP
jgi:hypothetical protein